MSVKIKPFLFSMPAPVRWWCVLKMMLQFVVCAVILIVIFATWTIVQWLPQLC